MRNSGKIIRLAIAFSIFIIHPVVFAESDLVNRTDVVSIDLSKLGYFEAEINLEFYLSNDIKNANIGYDIPEVSTGYAPLRAHNGLNQLTLFVSRNKNKLSDIETSHIEITAYKGETTFFKKRVPLVIHWPGPDYAGDIIGTSSIKKLDFSGVDKIRVNRNLSYSDIFIKNLLLNGFPIEKIAIFRPVQSQAGNNLVLSRFLGFEAAKNILHVFALSGDDDPLIKFSDSGGRHKAGEVYVGSGAFISKDHLISESDFEKLKDPNLSAEEMARLFDIQAPDSGQIAQGMYEEARDLIDTGRKGNLQRAKAILDELIDINPDYHQAYLELARYHMKINWPAGLEKAKRLILIARDIKPDYADTRVLLGYVYTNLGKYQEAHKEYELAEKLGTDNLWLYANWGLNYEKQSIGKDAIGKYLEVINYPKLTEENKRIKSWVLSQSKLFDFLIAGKFYKKADELYELSAEQFYYHKCDLQKQAALRVFQMEWYEGAVDSYIRSKKLGCNNSSAILSISYYMQWLQQKNNGGNASAAADNLRRAEAAAPSDAELFYGLAASDNTARLIPEMIGIGKNIDHVSPDGMSALLQSVKDKDLQRAKRLLDHGADVNIKSVNEYFRPIVYATYLKDIDMIKLLLEFDADTYIELEDGLYLDAFARSLGLNEVAELFAVKISS